MPASKIRSPSALGKRGEVTESGAASSACDVDQCGVMRGQRGTNHRDITDRD